MITWLGHLSLSHADPADASAKGAAQKSVKFEFSARPLYLNENASQEQAVDEFEVSFRIKDLATQQPLSGRRPGAWIDTLSSALGTRSGGCKEKIQSFLKSSTGARPIADLTSYYILSFNRDASISVIDPLVGISGRSNLLATIALSGPPGDWARSSDGTRLYVSIPSTGKLAIIDAESFRLLEEVEAGERPMRVGLSADERYVFVANDSYSDDNGGLTVIEAPSRKVLAHFPTGRGHHEMALSKSGELLFLSNREKGDVATIDVATHRVILNIPTGTTPISLAYSKLAQALYVADGTDGTVTVIDGLVPRIIGRIEARPGLGPLAITPDERWALVLNTKESLVHVIEIATNRLVQNISIGSRPYQIMLTDAFAYILSLDSERVGMISLKELGKPTAEQTSSFAAGISPPANAPELGVGASIARAIDDAAIVVANPADKTLYYYMEGMLAPSGSFLNPGKEVRSVGVIDHSLKESAPGVYSARARLPSGANYEAAIMLGSSYECFPLHVESHSTSLQAATKIDYLHASDVLSSKETIEWRFRVTGQKKQGFQSGASIVFFSTTGTKQRREVVAQEIGDGLYEARLSGLEIGAYYIYVKAPAWGVNYGDLPPANLIVRQAE